MKKKDKREKCKVALQTFITQPTEILGLEEVLQDPELVSFFGILRNRCTILASCQQAPRLAHALFQTAVGCTPSVSKDFKFLSGTVEGVDVQLLMERAANGGSVVVALRMQPYCWQSLFRQVKA